MTDKTFKGGCLCGALRWSADRAPDLMGFTAAALTIKGPARQYRSRAFRGTEATRNSCPTCGGLVFGGEHGLSDSHTIYAGSLDSPSLFKPTLALFNRDRPDWVILPDGLTVFETMPD
jgi:hypothetical protein